MKYHINLLPKPFEVETTSGLIPTPEQLLAIYQIEQKLDMDLMKDVISKMHKFYFDGQKHIEKILPKMIEHGAITQEQYDESLKDLPSLDSPDDFTKFYLDNMGHIEPLFSSLHICLLLLLSVICGRLTAIRFDRFLLSRNL